MQAYRSNSYPTPTTDVPAAVHALINAMKSIQTSLQAWASVRAAAEQVSDAYITFGNAFNAVVHAFSAYNIDTRDIHPIPQRLRSILEVCLGQNPSSAALAAYMPEVRQQLFDVLAGLRTKQAAWRAATGRPPLLLPVSLD